MESDRGPGPEISARVLLPAALLAASALALWVYRPALDGAFVSDDLTYVSDNAFVQQPSAEHLLEIARPWGIVPALTKNYAPVHLLLHAVEWRLFGRDVRGYHVVNVLLHALASLLLAVLLARSGLGFGPAGLGGALFLLHPANVEAVAWISQLKTVAALVLALGALLALPRRPFAATALFALGLLTKASAAVALPAAVLFAGLRARGATRTANPMPWGWLAAWTLLLGAYGVAQGAAFATDEPQPPIDPDPWIRVQSSLVFALRYLVMAVSTRGLSAFHEPEAVRSALDPELLAAWVVLALLAARTFQCLRGRKVEAAWWLFALLSFLPVSQIIPFRYPMADRYLYFVLPGLIGGSLLALTDWVDRLGERGPAASRMLALVAAGLLALFAARSHERAAVWKSPIRLGVDAAAHYPEGVNALLLRARSSASAGDADGSTAALRALMNRKGWNRFDVLLVDPAYRKVRDDPGFRALVAEMARGWIDYLAGFEDRGLTPLELRMLARAHEARGERAEARAALERALVMGGSFEPLVAEELERLRASEPPSAIAPE